MARVLSIIIAIVASVLLFSASVLAVAALLFFDPGGGKPAGTPTTVPVGDAANGLGPPPSGAEGSAPGATCQAGGDGGLVVAVAGARPGDEVIVAVELVDDEGRRHAQVVPAGAADDGGRTTAAVPAVLDGREIRGCTVTALQLGDRVVYAGR